MTINGIFYFGCDGVLNDYEIENDYDIWNESVVNDLEFNRYSFTHSTLLVYPPVSDDVMDQNEKIRHLDQILDHFHSSNHQEILTFRVS